MTDDSMKRKKILRSLQMLTRSLEIFARSLEIFARSLHFFATGLEILARGLEILVFRRDLREAPEHLRSARSSELLQSSHRILKTRYAHISGKAERMVKTVDFRY